jgi:RNA polymerase sigma-70 factor (ECF subfamily)
MTKSPEKWQTGDPAAFEELYRHYHLYVLRNAYLITGTREEAEDVLQEVFVSVWRSRTTFSPEKGAFATWLHRITVNECLRRRRRKQHYTVSLEKLQITELIRDEEQEEAMVTREELEVLMEALTTLDEKHRAVLVLKYFNDLSYDEIARVTGIPLGTVKSRIYHALQSMRERLTVQQEEARR